MTKYLDPMDMDKDQLIEERKRLKAYPWQPKDMRQRLEEVEDCLEELDDVEESNVKQLF